MRFKTFLESFDQTPLVPLAMKWMKNKWPEDKFNYTFKHNPKLSNPSKSFYVSVDGKEFEIAGKLFDTSGDGEKDTVVFRINPAEEDEPEEDKGF